MGHARPFYALKLVPENYTKSSSHGRFGDRRPTGEDSPWVFSGRGLITGENRDLDEGEAVLRGGTVRGDSCLMV